VSKADASESRAETKAQTAKLGWVIAKAVSGEINPQLTTDFGIWMGTKDNANRQKWRERSPWQG
jgi:hypothetical protein